MTQFNEEETRMTPHNGQPTPQFVRNLLGDPDDIQEGLAGLPYEQKLGLALVRISDEIVRHRGEHVECAKAGCESVRRQGRRLVWIFGAFAGFAALMAVVTFLIGVLERRG